MAILYKYLQGYSILISVHGHFLSLGFGLNLDLLKNRKDESVSVSRTWEKSMGRKS